MASASRAMVGTRLALVAAALTILLTPGCLAPDKRSAAAAARAETPEGEGQAALSPSQNLPRFAGPLPLEQAVTMAVSHNRQLQIAGQERVRAAGIRYEAKARLLPKLAFQGSYTNIPTVPSLDLLGLSMPMGEENNYSLSFAFQQTLFASGSNLAALRGSKAYVEAAQYAEQATLQLAVTEVRHAYYDALLTRELVRVTSEALSLAKSHLNDTAKRLEQGVASSFEKLRATVEVANVEAEAIRAENLERLAGANLLKLIGVSQDSEVELTDRLAYVRRDADLGAEQRRALEQRPDLKALALQVAVEKERLKITKADILPRVELVATDTWSKPGLTSSLTSSLGFLGTGGEPQWEENQSVTLLLQVPIFDGLSTHGRVLEQQASIRQAELKLLEQSETALLQVKQAVLSLQDAQKSVESQSANVDQAREALRLAEVAYREGVSKLLEVEDARTALTLAEQNYARAVHAHMVASLALEAATGSVRAPHATTPPE